MGCRSPALADFDYGDDDGFRAALRELGCAYAVAVDPARRPGWKRDPSLPGDAGRQALRPCLRHAPGRRSPFLYPQAAYRSIIFREGTKLPLRVVSPGWHSGPLTATPSASTGANEPGNGCPSSGPRRQQLLSSIGSLWPEPDLGIDQPAPRLREMALLAKCRLQVEQDLPGTQRRAGTGPLRRAALERVASPRHPCLDGPSVPGS